MAFLSCIAWPAQGQKDKWLLYPTEVDFDAGPGFSPFVFSNPHPDISTPYIYENSVFDEGGNLLFYIQDGGIYNRDGELEGNFAFSAQMKEVGVAPAPGTCGTYCVFYMEAYPSDMIFGYIEVVVDSNGDVSYVNGPFIEQEFSGNSGSLAVSQIISGTAADRYIYVVPYAEGEVFRYIMEENGLFFDQVVTSFEPENDLGSEVEISPCNSHLAWSIGPFAYVYGLESGQLHELFISEGYISGLEFTYDCLDLYLSHQTEGIVQWRFGEEGFTEILDKEGFGRTHLEVGKDNRMYLVRAGEGAGELWSLETDFNFFIPIGVEISVYSDDVAATADAYALPDQIDGEGDGAFYGVPPLEINGLAINGTGLPEDLTQGVPVFYDCTPIELEVDYTGLSASYTLSIVSVDPLTGLPLTGSPYLNYQETNSGGPDPAIDLRCLQDPEGCGLFDNYLGQVFLVSVAMSNECSEAGASGYFQVFGAPADVTAVNLEALPGNGPHCLSSQDINAPCPGGTYSTQLNFMNANGDVTFYRVKIWEVDCNTGAEIAFLYDGPVENVSSVNELSRGLNSFEINGSTGYFATNNFVGRCIKASVEVGNACGSAEDYTFIQFDGMYRPGPGEPGHVYSHPASQEALLAEAYPNPVLDNWALEMEITTSGILELEVFSQSGALLLKEERYVEPGPGLWQLNLDHLPAGAYWYRLHGPAIPPVSGKVIKL